MGISTPIAATTADCIRQIHGSAVANEIIGFEVDNAKWGFKATGYTTNANYHVKRTTLLLFINHRSVESSSIKKAIEHTYSAFLPKGGHPFTYLALDIDPARVDVNVHPTKREVNFLHEDEIIDEICTTIRIRLSEVDTSRTFLAQSLLPGAPSGPPKITAITNNNAISTPAGSRSTHQQSFNPPPLTPQSSSSKPLENALVRTDPSIRKITSMLPPLSKAASFPTASQINETQYTISPRAPKTCRLTSVKELRASVRDGCHARLTETIASLTYVGLVDSQKRIVALQSGVKLFLVDYGLLSMEFFYQLGLTDFSNFGEVRFDPPLSIKDLVAAAIEEELRTEKQRPNDDDDNTDWTLVPQKITNQLTSRREMLSEYFSMHISPTGYLESIPLLLKHYTPSLAKLPRFLARLGPCVDWGDEKGCFHTFLRELATFYAVERLPTELSLSSTSTMSSAEGKRNGVTATADDGDHDDHERPPIGDEEQDEDEESKEQEKEEEEEEQEAIQALAQRKQEIEHALEHVIFPAMRARLVATKGMLDGVLEVADLKGLYRVFERC